MHPLQVLPEAVSALIDLAEGDGSPLATLAGLAAAGAAAFYAVGQKGQVRVRAGGCMGVLLQARSDRQPARRTYACPAKRPAFRSWSAAAAQDLQLARGARSKPRVRLSPQALARPSHAAAGSYAKPTATPSQAEALAKEVAALKAASGSGGAAAQGAAAANPASGDVAALEQQLKAAQAAVKEEAAKRQAALQERVGGGGGLWGGELASGLGTAPGNARRGTTSRVRAPSRGK